jgi:hypothetical protein
LDSICGRRRPGRSRTPREGTKRMLTRRF